LRKLLLAQWRLRVRAAAARNRPNGMVLERQWDQQQQQQQQQLET
jgi:hypothetical protein